MSPCRVLLMSLLLMSLLTSCVVKARPHQRHHQQRAVQELTDIASNMAHTLDEVISMLSSNRAKSRQRRLVHFQVGRVHYSHRHSARNRRLRYRKQRASRNPNISDH